MKTKRAVLSGDATGSREATIPRERVLDNSLAFLREGYNFIGNRCRRYGTEMFETRLLLTRVTCVMGAEAARMFYGGDRFTRVGAMPISALKLLQDFGSVQLLDGEEHRHRKAMFVTMATPEAVGRLVETVRETWRGNLEEWQRQDEIVLFDELREILCRGVCAWAGLDLPESEVAKRTREFSEMIEASGSIGPRNWRAQWLRGRCERWIRRQLTGLRRGERFVDPQMPVQLIAAHRDLNGDLLALKAAAVEVINVLRATIAIARYMVFVALALHEHPECRKRVAADNGDYTDDFIQEVRRYYPFFPCIGGRVKQSFEWRGRRFEQGDWVVLDLHGTNNDPSCHARPERFDPGRRLRPDPADFSFIPQGAGDQLRSHRCPGEGITSALMKLAAEMLTRELHYKVPKQDLHCDLTRIPTLPRSGFRLKLKHWN